MRVLVVTPTFNEADALPRTVRRLRAADPGVDLLIVDDNSPDGTGALADELAAADPQIHVLHRPGKLGLGAAYRHGFDWGLQQGYDVLVEMDADGSHAPEQLHRLINRLTRPEDDAQLVIGSRWVPGGVVHNWPRRRMLLSRGANTYSRLALGMPLRDATAGFRAYRAEVLRAIDFDHVTSQGYCFQVEMAWRAINHGFRTAEVPIDFTEREQGASKMSGEIIREALWQITVWGARRHLRRVLSLPGARSLSPAAQRRNQASQ